MRNILNVLRSGILVDVLMPIYFFVIIIGLAGGLGMLVLMHMHSIISDCTVVVKQNVTLMLKDTPLMPAMWKRNVWLLWSILTAIFAVVLSGFAIFRGNIFLIGAVIVFAVAAAVSIIFLCRSDAKLTKLKEELGVVPESYKSAMKSIGKKYRKFTVIVMILYTLFFSTLSLLAFSKGDYVRGITDGALAVVGLSSVVGNLVRMKRGQ